jgi:hypothetical protein
MLRECMPSRPDEWKGMVAACAVLIACAGMLHGCGKKAATVGGEGEAAVAARGAAERADAGPEEEVDTSDPIAVAMRNMRKASELQGRTEGSEQEKWTPPRLASSRGGTLSSPLAGDQPSEPLDVGLHDAADSGAASAEPIGPLAPEGEPITLAAADPVAANAQRRAALATQLVEVVREAIRQEEDPLRASLPLIGLGLVESGVSEPELRELLEPLTEPERATVLAVRELLGEIAAGTISSTDPKALASALERHRERLAQAAGPGLEAGTTALCMRVDGFGRFTPLATSRLVAGRQSAAILYSEVRNFMQQQGEGGGSAPFVVELSQEVSLYTDGDKPVLQWKLPEKSIRSESQSRRSDFFLVQRLDFPRTLTSGAYVLRVSVRDKLAESASEGKPAPMFEVSMPLEVVADPKLASDPKSPKPVRVP